MSRCQSDASSGPSDVLAQLMTLWDASSSPLGCVGTVYQWNGHVDQDSIHSLLRYVEVHEERLRRKYLAWIHELGESRINGKRVIDHLALEDGLSYWWMTLLAEKSPYKSPVIDAIRLLAVEEIVIQQRPRKFRLVSSNRRLHEVLSELCQNLGVAYEWERFPHEPSCKLNILDIYRSLPQPLQAAVALSRHLFIRWPFKQAGKPAWFGGKQTLFFCSYFENIDPKAADRGYFHSHFWGGLPTLLQRMGKQSNWLQLFVPSATAPTPSAAMRWVQSFNRQREEQGSHGFLDAYLSWRIVARVFKRWAGLCLISWRLREIRKIFRPCNSYLSLWPIMRRDWQASMCGAAAISNLLWIELFDAAMRDVPHQEKGVYLCENISWERALIHAWHKHGHGQLIAAAVHVTIRFWDLRYFFDPRSIRSSGQYSMPQADVVALNGRAAIDSYAGMDYPKDAIVECEALRYGNLNDLRSRYAARMANENLVNILILGDYNFSDTVKALRLLEAAVPYISSRATYAIKPHPSCMVEAADYPSLHLKVILDPIGQILQDFDIVYSSNKTSAALDAYLVGLPVVVVLDETEPNFSPLRNQPGVRFVSTPEELAEALQTAGKNMLGKPDSDDFFFLDPELPRWERLLAS